jgi:hypothetical protein
MKLRADAVVQDFRPAAKPEISIAPNALAQRVNTLGRV